MNKQELCEAVQQSGYDSTAGRLTITVIKPGVSKNGRYYSEAVLKKSFGIFKGAKMFADHQTEAEQKAKPEGSVHNWVGSIDNSWVESDGTVMANAIVVDPIFKKKLELLAQNKMLGQMGISIRAVGEARSGEYGGEKCTIVESLNSCRSVDFVTFAAAGGRVDMIEDDQTRCLTTEETDKDKLFSAWVSFGLSPFEASVATFGPQESINSDHSPFRELSELLGR